MAPSTRGGDKHPVSEPTQGRVDDDNDHQPSDDRDRSGSPRPGQEGRSGKRMKYVQRACAQCRRRKLRCSGERPCARCVRFDQQCSLLSDDPRATKRARFESEELGLDASGDLLASSVPRSTASNGLVGILLERIDGLEAQTTSMRKAMTTAGMQVASHAMESSSRELQPRTDGRSSRGLGEMSDHGDEALADMLLAEGNRGDWGHPGPSTMPSPEPDTYGADSALIQPVAGLGSLLANELSSAGVDVDQSPSHRDNLHPSRPLADASHHAHSLPRHSIYGRVDSHQDVIRIRCGPVALAMPSAAGHDEYLDFYFRQINPFHPCVNENHTRQRSGQLYNQIFHSQLSTRGDAPTPQVPSSTAPFLALLFSIYACVDVLRTSVDKDHHRSTGFSWYRQSQELVGKRQLTTTGADITGVQILILQALFLCHRGNLDSGYAAIGRACRLCLQHGMNTSMRWFSLTPYQIHMRQRVFFTAFYMDRRISHSCGRPYGIRSEDIGIAQPLALSDSEIFPEGALPGVSPNGLVQPYMKHYIDFGNFAGRFWDTISSPTARATTQSAAIEALDSEIRDWLTLFDSDGDIQFPTFVAVANSRVQKQQRLIIRTLMLDLRLLLRRSSVINMDYDERTAQICAELSCAIIEDIHRASLEATWSSSYYLRGHTPTILFTPIIVLATLLIRHGPEHGSPFDNETHRNRFQQAVAIVQAMVTELPVAGFVNAQINELVRLTNACISARNNPQPANVPSDPLNTFDFSDLFSTELQHLTSQGGFFEASANNATAAENWWDINFNDGAGSSSSREQVIHEPEEFSWEALLASLTQNKSSPLPDLRM